MATREEKIKKINEELEKLDDEQLDKVAGGTFHDSYNVDDVKTDGNASNPANTNRILIVQ